MRRKPIPSLRQALERIETRRAATLLRHRQIAADRRTNAKADQRAIEHAIYGRLSPGMRAALRHRHASLQRDIEESLF
jgi:hypothetical protein